MIHNIGSEINVHPLLDFINDVHKMFYNNRAVDIVDIIYQYYQKAFDEYPQTTPK